MNSTVKLKNSTITPANSPVDYEKSTVPPLIPLRNTRRSFDRLRKE
jgi:hypothetical protein